MGAALKRGVKSRYRRERGGGKGVARDAMMERK